METKTAFLDRLAARLATARGDHPLRVGIDGRCGSGKTTLAIELVDALVHHGVPAVHLDSDGFHNLRGVRRRNTDDPARGYYDDAYDFTALADRVLRPLGPGGSGRYATKVHDLHTDEVVDDRVAIAESDAVVVFACTFLQRGELRDLWDEVVFLETRPEVATARGVARDAASLGGNAAAHDAYAARYMAACELYEAEERPAERASIVIGYDDPAAPTVIRGIP